MYFNVDISLQNTENFNFKIPVCKERNLFSMCRFFYLKYRYLHFKTNITVPNVFEPKQIAILSTRFYSKYSAFSNENAVLLLQMSNT